MHRSPSLWELIKLVFLIEPLDLLISTRSWIWALLSHAFKILLDVKRLSSISPRLPTVIKLSIKVCHLPASSHFLHRWNGNGCFWVRRSARSIKRMLRWPPHGRAGDVDYSHLGLAKASQRHAWPCWSRGRRQGKATASHDRRRVWAAHSRYARSARNCADRGGDRSHRFLCLATI